MNILPISTPRPLRPEIRILEVAIFFMASWPRTYLKKKRPNQLIDSKSCKW